MSKETEGKTAIAVYEADFTRKGEGDNREIGQQFARRENTQKDRRERVEEVKNPKFTTSTS